VLRAIWDFVLFMREDRIALSQERRMMLIREERR
jgi:hypothetical protein